MLKKFYTLYISTVLLLIVFISSASVCKDTSMHFPIHSKYSISSNYGNRYLKNNHFHNGIDIPKTVGTPVYPLSDGIISQIGFSKSYGNFIVITYDNGYKSLYGHMSYEYPFVKGAYVTHNDVIGYVGPKYLSSGKLNGFTTGPHLHFSLYEDGKHIDPLSIKYN